uniref:P/Homo B domain-containing protein n=1 Tax=Cyprinus carpio TaxID=7962 RepID=A0A8C1VF59_CYPCA
VSHLYGFGLMDAEAMVKEAETWKQVPPQHVCEENVVQTDRNISPERVLRSVFKSSGCSTQRLQWVVYLEHVVVRVTITHPHRGDLSVTLTSPSGTRSQLLTNRPNDHSNEGFLKWEFMTTHCWGERPTGDWILDISFTKSTLVYGMVISCVICVLFVVDRFGMDRYLFRGECVEVCPQAHFHTALKACEPCPSHCKLFSSATHCIRCEDSFYPNDGICNKLECVVCPDGFLEDTDQDICERCHADCELCDGPEPNNCDACSDPDHTLYRASVSRTCERCDESCAECLQAGAEVCVSCREGIVFSRKQGRCVSSCPDVYYHDTHHKTSFVKYFKFSCSVLISEIVQHMGKSNMENRRKTHVLDLLDPTKLN